MVQKHWGEHTPVVQKRPGVFVPPYVQAAAKDVEMTSYALLSYVEQKKITEALPIVKWLLTQRNPTGGFVSTQVLLIYYCFKKVDSLIDYPGNMLAGAIIIL